MERKKQVFDKIADYYSGESNEQSIKNQILKDAESHELFEWIDLIWTKLNPKEGHTKRIQNLTYKKIGVGKKPSQLFSRGILKYAAVVFAILGLGGILYFYPNQTARRIEVTSGIGQVKVVDLPDGSKAWLNAQSSVSYPEKFDKHREVEMDGEVYFEVEKNAEHPFVVVSDHIKVKVTGTSFLVSSYSNEPVVDTYLATGGIELELSSLDKTINLVPGDEFIYDKKTFAFTVENRPNAGLDSWRFGKISFYNESFYEIARKLERKFGKQIVIHDKNVGEMKLTADFDTETLEQIFDMLGEGTGVKVSKFEQGFLIQKK